MREDTYLEFNNPIQIVWRKGSADDPFVDRLDISKVVNQRMVLLEIPDELYRVRITDMQEINYDTFIKDTIAPNEFYVDYNNGFVYFHASKEAKTITAMYKGRGFLLYPASRIVSFDGSEPSESLQNILDSVKEQIKLLIDETQNFEELMKKMVIATNLAKDATDGAIQATQDAKDATELVRDAYKTTVLIYMPFVQTESDIAITYPNPQVGWTVQVYDSGIRYRWNGADWIPIDAVGGSIPLASEFINGLLSKEDFVKLKGISSKVDVRGGLFVLPQEVLMGVQDPHFESPFKGKINSITASVAKSGASDTIINIEKSKDYVNWVNITPNPIQINTNEHFDNKLHSVSDYEVEVGDIFRLNIPTSSDIRNLTLNLMIEID